jgi:hypothetical protein
MKIDYAPQHWTAEQRAAHEADSLDDAFKLASMLSGGWYRRQVTIDVRYIGEDERYMIRPSDIEPYSGWTPCYTVARA